MFKYNSDTDRYGDGDVPEVDYKPYQDNNFEPHPQTDGDNQADDSTLTDDISQTDGGTLTDNNSQSNGSI